MTTPDEIDRFQVFFDTLEVGQRFTSPRRTVTEADIVNFAGLSGDYNALHTDAVHAASTPHGERIAHGLLVLAITSGLSTRLPVMRAMEGTLLGLTNLQVRWRRPTRIGDTLHVDAEVIEKQPGPKPDRGTIVLRRSALNQSGEVVMISDWSLMLKRAVGAEAPIGSVEGDGDQRLGSARQDRPPLSGDAGNAV